jgi:hypothetical protein
VLPDLLDDHATGIRGFPHRCGARASAITGPVLLVLASVVILLGPPGEGIAIRIAALAGAVTIAVWATFTALRDPRNRRYFLAVIAIALLDVVIFALSGTSI